MIKHIIKGKELTTIAQKVLDSSNSGELEAVIEELVSDAFLYAGLVFDTIEFVATEKPLLEALEKIGIKRENINLSLKQSLFLSKIDRILLGVLKRELNISLLSSIEDFLYNPNLPIEISEMYRELLKSEVCLLTLIHLTECQKKITPWQIKELSSRWLRGQEKSLPTAVALALEFIEELPKDLWVEIDQYLEHSEALNLNSMWLRSKRYNKNIQILAEDAARQNTYLTGRERS